MVMHKFLFGKACRILRCFVAVMDGLPFARLLCLVLGSSTPNTHPWSAAVELLVPGIVCCNAICHGPYFIRQTYAWHSGSGTGHSISSLSPSRPCFSGREIMQQLPVWQQ